ncbi:MAG TPA: hypothetical protein VK897_16660 [Anaerolineales bacterium]|nr:hypothetical protein [Anaerolineales bacterium]
MVYLPGITFLFLTSAVITVPFAIHIQNKMLTILLSVCLSTLILKLWAFFATGAFDPGFLIVQIAIGTCAAVAVNLTVSRVSLR